jgi:hypothetical protein
MTKFHTFEVQSRRHGTRIFHHIGTRPYHRHDGTMTTLSVWQTKCVQCGTPFQITTPARARKSGAFGIVHCLEHRRCAARTDVKPTPEPKPSTSELERMLQRLETILPIVRQQQREANDAAEVAYFTAKGTPEQLDKLLVLDVTELLQINYQRVNTPEACELHSIGLAVAAFGGRDAISEIGWMLANRGCRDAQFIWSRWDRMSGYWL